MYEHNSQGHYGKIVCKNGYIYLLKRKNLWSLPKEQKLKREKKSILRSSRSSYASETWRRNRLEPSNRTAPTWLAQSSMGYAVPYLALVQLALSNVSNWDVQDWNPPSPNVNIELSTNKEN